MEIKDYLKRYVRYGVVKDEGEFVQICSLTKEIEKVLFPIEFENSSTEKLKRFTMGFCEGCLFQNIFAIMRLIHCGFESDEIVRILGVEENLVEEIRNEFVLRSGT